MAWTEITAAEVAADAVAKASTMDHMRTNMDHLHDTMETLFWAMSDD